MKADNIVYTNTNTIKNTTKIKSQIKIGNIYIENPKHFNWLQKKMWKILLGVEIEDYEIERDAWGRIINNE